jgi:hypothetical protein
MKKALVTLVVVSAFALLIGGTALAQDMGPKTYLGVKAGIDMANLTGSDVDNTDMKIGFTGGAMGHVHFNEMFSVQIEALYAMKGAKADVMEDIDVGGTIYSFDGEEKLKLNYLEIPVLLRLDVPNKAKVDPFFYAGPAISFLLSAKDQLTGTATPAGGGSAVDIDEEVDIKDMVKSTDFGIIFGAGLGYEVGTGHLVLDARYNLGMSKIDDTEDEANVKNGVISIMVGYQFPIGQ